MRVLTPERLKKKYLSTLFLGVGTIISSSIPHSLFGDLIPRDNRFTEIDPVKDILDTLRKDYFRSSPPLLHEIKLFQSK